MLRIGKIALLLITGMGFVKFIEQSQMILRLVLVHKNHFVLIMQGLM